MGVLQTGQRHQPVPLPLEGVRVGADLTAPMRTQTARAETGIAVPPFIAVLRGNCDATAITGPLGVVTSSAAHHALISPPELAMVMRTNTPRGHPGQMCTPATGPMRTITAWGSQSLITWEHLAHLLIPYYRDRCGPTRLPARPGR